MKKHFTLLTAALACLFTASCSSSDKADKETQVNWATFNIRYDNPADNQNNWKFRKDSVAKFILSHDIDIVGMQEVLHNQLEDLKARLPEYTEVGVGRDDGKQAGEYAPLFFKKDRFEVLDTNTFWLSQYPDSVGFIGWDGACCRIATWAKLKDKKSGKIFMAVNTHFDHVGVEARRKGALLIIDKIKEIVGDKPAVLTGDFNVNDASEAYATLTTNEFVLKDAFKVSTKKTGVNYTFHDFGNIADKDCEKIDFTFVTPQIKVKSSFIPKEPDGETGFLSDHNPEVTTLSF